MTRAGDRLANCRVQHGARGTGSTSRAGSAPAPDPLAGQPARDGRNSGSLRQLERAQPPACGRRLRNPCAASSARKRHAQRGPAARAAPFLSMLSAPRLVRAGAGDEFAVRAHDEQGDARQLGATSERGNARCRRPSASPQPSAMAPPARGIDQREQRAEHEETMRAAVRSGVWKDLQPQMKRKLGPACAAMRLLDLQGLACALMFARDDKARWAAPTVGHLVFVARASQASATGHHARRDAGKPCAEHAQPRRAARAALRPAPRSTPGDPLEPCARLALARFHEGKTLRLDAGRLGSATPALAHARPPLRAGSTAPAHVR